MPKTRQQIIKELDNAKSMGDKTMMMMPAQNGQ
jgi:hypothetical protein